VDVSIADENGELLDMGTEYDYFGEEAQPELEGKMLAEKKLTAHQVENRKLLRSIMKKAGFRVLPSEWWHFNSCSREEARKKYRVVE
jgi:D-alanyl-D-alanine dipeptidase